MTCNADPFAKIRPCLSDKELRRWFRGNVLSLEYFYSKVTIDVVKPEDYVSETMQVMVESVDVIGLSRSRIR